MNDDLLIERYEHAGLTVEIHGEALIEDYMNPRECARLLGVMVTEHRNYRLGGGSNDLNTMPEFELGCPRCNGTGDDPERAVIYRGFKIVGSGSVASMTEEMERDEDLHLEAAVCSLCKGDWTIKVDPVTFFRETEGARVVLALNLYDHSGISMSASRMDEPAGYHYNDRWDSGVVGFYFDTAETRADGWDEISDERIEEILLAEIKVYDQYLTGDVYCYVVKNTDGEELDSCGTYYGSADAKEQANAAAEYERDNIDNKVLTTMIVRGEN